MKFYTTYNPAVVLPRAGYRHNLQNKKGFIRPLTSDLKNNRFHCFAGITKTKKYVIDLHFDKTVRIVLPACWRDGRFLSKKEVNRHKSWLPENKQLVKDEIKHILQYDFAPEKTPLKKSWLRRLISLFK